MQKLVKFITFLMARLPLSAVLGFGKFLGWIQGSVIRHRRRDVFDALRKSFPEKSEPEIKDIARQMYRNFGMNLVEILRLAGGSLDEFKDRIAVEGREIVDQALQRGKGVFILTAHFGNWDLLGMFTVKHNYKLTIISKDLKNKTVNAMWMTLREKFGVGIIPAHNSARASLKVLKRNELIGFILDQNRPLDQGIFVDFFGRPACTSPGLAILSAQTQTPIVPVFIHRTPDGNHLLQILPIIEPPPDREPETVRLETQKYTKIIEDQIRQYPEQWIWLHRRWKTRPLDEAGVQAHPTG